MYDMFSMDSYMERPCLFRRMMQWLLLGITWEKLPEAPEDGKG